MGLELKDTIALCVGVFTVVGGVLAYYINKQNLRFRQTEWLFNLYQKFYEEPQYKRIRYILDFKPKEEFSKLQSAVEEDKEDSIVDDLTDYLNFFEFVCSLWRMNQVTSGEILFLFQYYIENLSSIEFVKSIIEKEGFESLSLFIKRQHYSN